MSKYIILSVHNSSNAANIDLYSHLVSRGGLAEGQACIELGARTPIGARRILIYLF